jgi:hypothetical protein
MSIQRTYGGDRRPSTMAIELVDGQIVAGIRELTAIVATGTTVSALVKRDWRVPMRDDTTLDVKPLTPPDGVSIIFDLDEYSGSSAIR